MVVFSKQFDSTVLCAPAVHACAGGGSARLNSGKDGLNCCISEVLPQGNLFVTKCWHHFQFHIFTVACFLFLLQTLRSATV